MSFADEARRLPPSSRFSASSEGKKRAPHVEPAQSVRVPHGETLREYLDVEIGRVVLGKPVRTLREVSAALGNISKDGVFFVERRILLKVGRAVRTAEGWE